MSSPDHSNSEEYLSTLYHALRAKRRRHLIRILQETESRTVSTRELARKTASHELQVPEEQATGEPYRNAYNALSQTHLPTLSEAGIIIYDPERQTVTRGADFELVALLLDTNTPTVSVFISLLQHTDLTDDD